MSPLFPRLLLERVVLEDVRFEVDPHDPRAVIGAIRIRLETGEHRTLAFVRRRDSDETWREIGEIREIVRPMTSTGRVPVVDVEVEVALDLSLRFVRLRRRGDS
jgi:hypothetical protein